MPDLHLAVIIPSSLNAPQIVFLRQALLSMKIAQQVAKHTELKIFIVSAKHPSKSFQREYPEVTFVRSEVTNGFGEMNNLGLQELQQLILSKKIWTPDWLLLLNDDARVAGDFFKVLHQIVLERSRAKKADILSPCIFEAKNSTEIDSYGVEYFKSGYAKNNRETKIQTTLSTSGCQLIRWSFVEKYVRAYGFFFNELYFYYLEDIDLSIRAIMIGGRIVRQPELIAYHHGSTTSGGKRNTFSLKQTYRNILWVIICCWPVKAISRNMLNILLLQVWLFLYGSTAAGITTYPSMLFQTLRALPKLFNKRQKIIRTYADVDFNHIFSPYSFRTYHNRTIRAL